MKSWLSVLGRMIASVPLIAWMGCSSSTGPSTTGTLSLASGYTAQQFPTGVLKVSGVAAVDSVKITRARLVIRDVKFKSTVDSLSFISSPTVIELSMTGGVQSVAANNVPYGTYVHIEFNVHRVDSSEIASLPAASRALFADFLAGERYSILVDGTVYKTGAAAQAFTYRSKIDVQQKFDLVPQMVVSASSSSANATMLISSFNWFRNQVGVLVDPTDPNSQGVIDENLKNSVRVFKDNNKQGTKDAS